MELLERISELFQHEPTLATDDRGEPADLELQAATAILLLEAAYGDAEYVWSEHRAIVKGLEREFAIGKQQALALMGRAEKIRPPTVTLEDVSEDRALETLLRSATGYVAAPRPAGAPGASRFDRILILVSQSASAPAAVSPESPRAVNRQPTAPGGASPVMGTPGAVPTAPPVFPQAPAFNPTQPRILPGNPFLQPPTAADPPPQTAPRPGIIIPLPQATPPGVRQ